MSFRLPARTIWQASPKLASLPRVVTQTPRWARGYATPATGGSRTAIVTGSSRGIGKAIALRLANDGYDVCINDVAANKPGCDDVVKEIQGLGRKAYAHIADVSNLQEVQELVKASASELGPLNTMVANAVYGVFNCYKAAAEQMISQGSGGKLLGAASIVAFKPFPLLSHYSASKWAVRGLTQAFAMEMAEHKITVNAYAPGIVGTAMWDLIDEKLGEKTGAKKGDTIKKYTNELIALGRTSVPEDVASTVSFLSSKDSDYMTGQTIVIDGGIIFT
ncbi:hypothetical protein E8E12_007042 [Didymella heteroderae]|uniref:Acetoin dehydrogenase-like protein n=1 Tax=Didymella heteroderae TaxID=1769908 RepID=A0A9P4WRN4_9PLEO|nr:hypothetical protein E8E12_007042 [Didymella heteroderae]